MKNLFLVSIFLAVVGCGAIPKYEKKNFVPVKNLKDIEGEYDNYPDNNTKFEYQTINNIINWKANKIDTFKVHSVTIKVANQIIEFISHKENGETVFKKVSYQLKDNGFIFLKNRNFRLTGIPYILGYYDVKKLELGLTNQKDLIINGIEQSEGALLFVLGSSSPKHNLNFVFKRK